MKIVDLAGYNIVKPGIEFQIQSTTAREDGAVAELLPDMERNEGAVFWLEPKGGTVEQQEACICVNGVFYALNSKFEKAIFRNVRLTREFKNYERMVDGTSKLVIPRSLFSEKMRTSRRVRAGSHTPPSASVCPSHTQCAINVLYLTLFPQNISLMRKLEGKRHIAEPQVLMKAAAPAQESVLPETPAPAQEPALPETPPPAQEPALPEAPAPAKPARKQKRQKRTHVIEHTFAVAGQVLKGDPKRADRAGNVQVPPLTHTPHSLFRMLCDVFEQEFPNTLPPDAIEHMLQALRQKT